MKTSCLLPQQEHSQRDGSLSCGRRRARAGKTSTPRHEWRIRCARAVTTALGLAPRRWNRTCSSQGQEVPRCFPAGRCAPGCSVVSGMAAVALPARADEPADRGISMSAWAGAAVDRSVVAADSGRPLHDGAPLDRRHRAGQHQVGRRWAARSTRPPESTAMGGCRSRVLLGVQPEVDGSAFRCWARPDAIASRTWAAPCSPTSSVPNTWLPYLGVRLGVARTVPAHGMFEVGAWLFGRYDVGEATVTNVGTSLQENPDRLPAGRLDVRAGASGRAAPRGRGPAPHGRDDDCECAVMAPVRACVDPDVSRISCARPRARIPCVRAAHFS